LSGISRRWEIRDRAPPGHHDFLEEIGLVYGIELKSARCAHGYRGMFPHPFGELPILFLTIQTSSFPRIVLGLSNSF
jgi:hypothetical protein